MRKYIMFNINNRFFCSILLFFTAQSFSSDPSQMTDAATAAASKLGIQIAAEKAVEALPYISVTVQLYSIGTEIKAYVSPNEEQEAHAREVKKMHALLTAEKQFINCLIKHREGISRSSSGCPIACEEIARMFVMLGGKSESRENDRHLQ